MNKFEYYRDPDLLKLANGEECLLKISPRCRCDEGSTTVACHANDLIFGKGMGIKSSDANTVWGCYSCHTMLDQGHEFSKRQKAKIFDEAWYRQVTEWHKIADNPLLRPWKVEAAKRVIRHIEGKE